MMLGRIETFSLNLHEANDDSETYVRVTGDGRIMVNVLGPDGERSAVMTIAEILATSDGE